MHRWLAVVLVVLVAAPGCYRPKGSKPAKKDPPKKDEKIVGKLTKEIMDIEEVRKNHPDWVVESPEVEGNDPFSVIGTGYDAITFDAAQISWNQWLAGHKILNDDRLPNFAQAKHHLERETQGLPMVRPYRHWVYDSSTGGILLMLDKEHRNKVYREKGIAIPKD